jgi:hypothetical protein
MLFMKEYLIHMLDHIQYEFSLSFTTFADPEQGAWAEASIFRLQLRIRPEFLAPCGSGSTTFFNTHNLY